MTCMVVSGLPGKREGFSFSSGWFICAWVYYVSSHVQVDMYMHVDSKASLVCVTRAQAGLSQSSGDAGGSGA